MLLDYAESFKADGVEYKTQDMTDGTQPPIVVVALPFAYQDGMDKYNGIMRFLRETGTGWELCIVRETLGREQLRRSMSESVAGVICGTAGRFEDDQRDAYMECLDVCRRTGIPFVGLDWPLGEFRWKPMRRCSFLNIDSEKVGEFAAEVFQKAGEYASYGFVGTYPDTAWSRSRGAFFARGLRKAGRRNIRLFKGDFQNGASDLRDWLKSLRKPAAVFAANDCAADVVMKACQRSGLRVPEDFAVLGVDDDPVFCVHTRPTLSSIHPDFEEMGYVAAKELARLMSGKSVGRRIVVAGGQTVTKRMSTAPCSPAGVLVRRVDEIIAARACERIDSDVIASELKISRRLLDLRYRQLTGKSVREAIIQARVDRAKHLLTYSGHPIGTISRLCGYRTESYLGKVFMSHEGVSMGEYRSRHGKGAERSSS